MTETERAVVGATAGRDVREGAAELAVLADRLREALAEGGRVARASADGLVWTGRARVAHDLELTALVVAGFGLEGLAHAAAGEALLVGLGSAPA